MTISRDAAYELERPKESNCIGVELRRSHPTPGEDSHLKVGKR